MTKSFRLTSLNALALGLVCGCSVWSPAKIVTDRPVTEHREASYRMSDGSNQVVFLRRNPAAGGELTLSGVPLEQLETLYGPEKSPDETPAKSLLQGMEYCKLIAESSPGAVSTVPSTNGEGTNSKGGFHTNRTTIAGRIVSVDDDSIVLEDVVVIDEPSARATGTPIVNKVPYVSRLFKNSGTWVEPKSIPGQVNVSLRGVQQVESIAAANWPSVRQTGSQRIGVDFDFSIPTQP